MPAEKKNKSKPVKNAAGAGSTKKSAAKPQQAGSGSNNTAFFMLVIVILITIIVLMLNRFYDRGAFKFPDFKKMFPAREEIKDKKTEPLKEKKPDESRIDVNKEKSSEKDAIKDKDDKKDEKPETAIKQKEISIYLLKLDEKTERIYLSSVRRNVTDKEILSTALDNLIKGPSSYEKDRGYITAVPSGLKVRGIAVKGKTAEIDFNGSIEEGAAGDILLKRVQQIVYTATQFDNIDSVIIKINGQRRRSMGSDGFSISGPLKR